MEYRLDHQGDEYRLAMGGNFTFSDNSAFRNILSKIKDSNAKTLTLKLEQLEFIDSAALGMLLLLHDVASRKGLTVLLDGASGQIKKMLQLSNFDEIFRIHYL